MNRTLGALIVLCLLSVTLSAQTLPCYRVESPPAIDGGLDDPQWKTIPRVTGFVQFGQGQGTYTRLQTFAQVAWDDEALYIAFDCLTPQPDTLVIGGTEHDGSVGSGDAIEIFLDTNRDRRTYYQIVSNPGGAIHDGKEMDKSWNADYDVNAAVGKSSWSLEIAIPFESLGVPVPEDKAEWGVNLCRDSSPAQTGRKALLYTSWTEMKGGFHKPAQFRALLFCKVSLEDDAVSHAETFLNRAYLGWLDKRLDAAARELGEATAKMRKLLAVSEHAAAYQSKQAELDGQIAQLDTTVAGDTVEARVESLSRIDGVLAAQTKLWNDFRFFDLFAEPAAATQR